MTDKIRAFKLANAGSPITMSEWLDKNKRSPKGPPETWMYRRIRLADGTTFVFSRDDDLGDYRELKWAGVSA